MRHVPRSRYLAHVRPHLAAALRAARPAHPADTLALTVECVGASADAIHRAVRALRADLEPYGLTLAAIDLATGALTLAPQCLTLPTPPDVPVRPVGRPRKSAAPSAAPAYPSRY